MPLGTEAHHPVPPALIVAAKEGRALRTVQRVFLDLEHSGYLERVTLGTPTGASWQGSA